MTDERSGAVRPADDEISLLEVGSLLLRQRRAFVRSLAIFTLVALALALFTPARYTSHTSFVPQAPSEGAGGLGGLASLAGQFGVSVPTGNEAESPDFYAELVKSREILGTLASQEFSFLAERDDEPVQVRGTLPDLLELKKREPDPAVRREAAIKWLSDEGLAVRTGRQTGIVSVSVTTPWPGLSHAISDRMLDLVNGFNLQTRQSQAAAERAFIETRIGEAQDSLRAAEDRLEEFLENNRQWAGSPELTFQRDRLQRRVAMQQEVYTGLAEAYEQARIAEVRNTPVITVVERPELPVKPDPRRRVLKLLLGVMLGTLAGVFVAFARGSLAQASEREATEYLEFSSLWSQTRADLRALTRFGRARSSE